jgi:glycosyltransferase involved in cell wall biosynthesis
MRIAQVAPVHESVPPRLYGGTERIVSYLTEELVRQGHKVTLFASGDSITGAELAAVCPRALRLEDRRATDPLAQHVRMVEMIARQAREFDIVHFHIDYVHFPMVRRERIPAVSTLHNRLDIADLRSLYREFQDMNLVSISDAQRKPMRWARWVGTVYHGLPKNLYRPQFEHGKYLAFIGRISPEKRVDRAIEIAKRTGIPLKIAAKVAEADKPYFETRIRKLLDSPLIEYVGEINEREKSDFLGCAYALLFPIDWPEPFGLVMIEALACGTPVVAYGAGSVPEVIDDGQTGYVVKNLEQAERAVLLLDRLDRRTCRHVFEERFSAERMTKDYLTIYRDLRNRLHRLPAATAMSRRAGRIVAEIRSFIADAPIAPRRTSK